MKPKFRCFIDGIGIVGVKAIYFDSEQIILEPFNGIENQYISLEEVELMQSTGLKDKNGVEIFYGDIVKVSYKEHSYVSYITYEFHETTIEGKYIHEDFHYYENPLYIIFEDDDNDHTIEVIGNIYEHPHLLEE
ncbi:hypothetical protein BUY98_09380 [Staphylococcus gallinarum]|uniref:YopX family protein n=1 Tax=Staphylococcus gallinarum TaxID=1293 RepID=UPI000E69DC69|nr:YopX family protein [Staphylococcus gallinarum]RIL32653.1 hypothetical protein BUY98_09380 [Staphylococcus gallinarum]